MIGPWLRRLAVPLVVGVIGLGLSGCESRVNDAATVTYHDNAGDHTVHISHNQLDDELHALLANPQFASGLKTTGLFPNVGGKVTTDTQLSSRWLTSLISQTAVDAEFTNDKLAVTADDTAQGQKDSEQGFPGFTAFDKSFADKLVERDARIYSVYRYYATCPSGRFVSHILLKTKAQADAALALIRSGEKFADIAKTQSTDTGSAKQGGALGCLSPNEFVPEFQRAAEGAPLGVVTDPVKSEFGYHLIVVRRWDATADAAYVQALNQAGGAVLTARLRDLKVWVNPRYGTWGPQANAQGGTTFAVIPPAAPKVRTCREDTPKCAPPTTTTTAAPTG